MKQGASYPLPRKNFGNRQEAGIHPSVPLQPPPYGVIERDYYIPFTPSIFPSQRGTPRGCNSDSCLLPKFHLTVEGGIRGYQNKRKAYPLKNFTPPPRIPLILQVEEGSNFFRGGGAKPLSEKKSISNMNYARTTNFINQ